MTEPISETQQSEKPTRLKEKIAEQELPRERMMKSGPEVLSVSELLAIILETGTKGENVLDVAAGLVKHHGGLNGLALMSLNDLRGVNGIGPAKAVRLAAVFELGKRYALEQRNIIDTRMTTPGQIAEFFQPMLRDERKEKFYVVFLNSANIITGYECVTEGILDQSLVHPREVFHAAIRKAAKSILLIHNHPSGNSEPSSSDIAVTKKLVESGTILGIHVLDHLIIAGDSYTSLLERGMI